MSHTFIKRRMTHAICREYQVRSRAIAEINVIGTVLRSLAPLQAARQTRHRTRLHPRPSLACAKQ